MPLNVRCSKCGYEIYSGPIGSTNRKGGTRYPSDIIKKAGGTCPNCGKTLEFSADRVKVEGVEEASPVEDDGSDMLRGGQVG